MESTLVQALKYVHNTGGFASLDNFIEDHKPIGDALWLQLRSMNLVMEDSHDKIQLTSLGTEYINEGSTK